MSKKQIAQVIDLNKCIGCQTCTISCKTLWTNEAGMENMYWNIVNSYPGKGFPKNWESMGGGWKDGELVYGMPPSQENIDEAWKFNFNEAHFEGNKNHVQLKPKGDRPQWGPNWDEEQGEGIFPNSFYFNLPRSCNHCSNPPCLEACPNKAIYKREEDGIVLIDDKICKAATLCQMACPYKVILFNEEKSVSQKCIACFPRLEKSVAPACVRQCPGRARHFGFLEDNKSQVYKLVHDWKVALPLHPEFNTQPNIYYVPPILPKPLNEDGTINENDSRIPIEMLQKLFGNKVDIALHTLENEIGKKDSELIALLISRKWTDMFSPFDATPDK